MILDGCCLTCNAVSRRFPYTAAVNFDANLAVARSTLAAGGRRCGLVSAMGANAKSSVFYNRVKGELEEALAQLPFDGLVVARPSLLLGNPNVAAAVSFAYTPNALNPHSKGGSKCQVQSRN
jgi:uncharacterized protein YbjT (DUF2867 family)